MQTDRQVEVGIAATEADREAVFRFRYEVYVEELGRYRDVADHAHRRLADPEDDHSWIVCATLDGDVVGTVRITWGGHGFSRRQVEQYQLAPFLAEIPSERMSVGERTMISPRLRGTDLFDVLTQPCEQLTLAHDVRVVFGACEPHLISLYAGYQRPYGSRNINAPEAGFLIPLLSFPKEPEALVEYGPNGQLPTCVQEALASTGTVECAPLLGTGEYERRVVQRIGDLASSLFDGMDGREVAACIGRSNVVTCRSGDRLLKAGGSARNTFVVLEGSLAVSRDGRPVGTVGPGEVVGEMAYLLQQPRGFDVDVVEDGTRVLSLSERTLSRLGDVDPAAAAKLASNISRQLCHRLVAASDVAEVAALIRSGVGASCSPGHLPGGLPVTRRARDERQPVGGPRPQR